MLKPVAVITCLEDSPASFDRLLLSAYLSTDYRVKDMPGFSFTVGRPVPRAVRFWLAERAVKTWTFVTAWNPGSGLLDPVENDRRNKQLEALLVEQWYVFYPGAGIGTDPAWLPEASFWVLNPTPSGAMQLGLSFGQNAIVWWAEGKAVALWWLLA